jgi:hypothetical protein
MLRIKYEREASNYFFDNGDLTRELRIAVETLFFTDGIPPQSKGEHFALPDNMHVWRMLGHAVIYDLTDDVLTVWHVIPLA